MPEPVAPRFRDESIDAFVAELASAEPVPGGGAASAVAASLAAGLVSMVASLSRGRTRYEPYLATIERGDAEGHRLADRLLALADEDAAAYAWFGDAMKLSRGTDEEKAIRTAAIGEAALHAARVPAEVLRCCRDVVVQAEALAGRSNLNAASDLSVAAHLSVAAAHGAAENVRVNLPFMTDRATADDLGFRSDEALADVERIARAVRAVVASGALREPLEE
jgi:formiminotetrahydrofolate cyclodeaminase